MRLTKEEAIFYHRQMWSDMQKELGENPKETSRIHFKKDWVYEHFPDEKIFSNCFLCEYIKYKKLGCDECPIKWNGDCCGTYYLRESISKILALPEREGE